MNLGTRDSTEQKLVKKIRIIDGDSRFIFNRAGFAIFSDIFETFVTSLFF